MAKDEERLFELARGTVEGMGYCLVAVEDRPEHGRRVLRFIIDHPRGIGIEDCAAVSRELGYVLDGASGIDERYALEVSSPGTDRELRTEREYLHFAGREVRMVLREPVGGRSVVQGTIVGVGPDGVRVRPRGEAEDVVVPLGGISRARLVGEEKPRPEAVRDAPSRGCGS
ncbi:MAG: ribosome maturation factor RimP [Candidatus Eisenbacteria bacterium]|nr:ribosome maturation factor RimP [Candidatus Eisenbacteria bacterium]